MRTLPWILTWTLLAVTLLPIGAAEADLEKRLQAARRLATEDLAEPVKSVREGMLLWTPNPDGKTWDLLQVYFPQYGGPNTIVVIDLGTGEVKQVQTERSWNFHLCPSVVAPNGKLFISALDGRLRQKICVYDPATNELKLDAVKMPEEILGETHPLVLGTDGKLYAIGQHPSRAAAAVGIDPDSLQATLYGPIGPSHAPNACWGYSGGADERFVYVASGKIPWYLVAFERKTGQSRVLAETATVGGMVSVGQGQDGCTASVTRSAESGRMDYWLHEGQAVARSSGKTPPWLRQEPPTPQPPRPEVNTDLAVPDVDGFAELRVRVPAGEDAGWKRFRFQVPLYAQSIYRLMELPDGRLFGTAGAYEGNFIYDPKTNKAEHLGKIHLSHYATTLAGGKIYMSGYPSSPLYVYDPAKPWTAGKLIAGRLVRDEDQAANPRQLLLMGNKKLAGTHKMYGAAAGADGKVYFGGQWVRDGACGGLAWYDPRTGKAGGMWDIFSNYQITHLAIADEGRYVVISTKRVEDHVLKKPKPAEGALFFFDTRSGKITGQFAPVPGAKGTGPILPVGGSRVIGWTEDPKDEKQSILYAVDVKAAKRVFSRSVPYPLPVAIGSNQQEAWDFRLGPDGRVWAFLQGVLVRIDPADGSMEAVGRPPSPGRIAFAEGHVYLAGTTAIRRISELTVMAPR